MKPGIQSGLMVALMIVASGGVFVRTAQASCGAITCFVVIGSQQQVPQQGLLAVNLFYGYTPMRLQSGTSGVIPAIDQEERRLILDHHRETKTLTQSATLDLNYGITDRLGIEVMLPYLSRTHKHFDGLGEDGPMGEGENVDFSANGLGDLRIIGKYNILPTLRSTLITGLGVELPTGKHNTLDAAGRVMEAPTQLGRGQVGLIGSVYHTYQIIPQRLSEFAYASYRHTFRNNDGYQFGDEYLLNVGLNLVTVPWLVLTSQFNYRYQVHDNISANLEQSKPSPTATPGDPDIIDSTIKNRRVPNTGSTWLAFTPGFQLNFDGLGVDLLKNTQVYFFAQIPIARDANNNLVQDTSFTFGLTQYFQLGGAS